MTKPLQHLIAIEDLTKDQIVEFLKLGKIFKDQIQNGIKRFPILSGKTVVALFYEPSTRTRGSFEIAAKQLGADFVFMSADASTSVSKGESLIDTARNLEAMNPDFLVLRHACSGAPQQLLNKVKIPLVNAGDGFHEHPTQALLDALTIQEHFGSIQGLKVTIIGDIAHSRVARSNIHLLKKMGARVTVAGPATLLPPKVEAMGVFSTTEIRKAVTGADVVMMLRIQFERQNAKQIPSTAEYFRFYGLHEKNANHLSRRSIIMHPGPLNRGVEISPEVADGEHSVILNQVTNGVAIRMAVLTILSGYNWEKNFQ